MTIRNLNETITTATCKYGEIDGSCCATTYSDGCGYVGFIGGIEVSVAKLSELVPEGFINSSKIVNEEQVQKTWGEYCLHKTNEIVLDEVVTQEATTALLHYMHVWNNGNRHRIDEYDEAMEWRKWYEHFGVDLLTKSTFLSKRDLY